MTLVEVKDWIKSLNIGEHFYAGKIDANQEKAIGVYARSEYGPAEVAIGGIDSTKTEHKRYSLLIHWNKNARETEAAAQYLYNNLLCADVTINGVHIDYLALEVPYPVDVGTDENGIYERVIWMDLYYQKQED